MNPSRVLIVDDSSVMRKIIRQLKERVLPLLSEPVEARP